MEIVRDALINSKKCIGVADHMLTQTMKFVQEPKILATVLNNIFSSMLYSMYALLFFERQKRRIPPFHNNYVSRIYMFRIKVAPRYGLAQYLKTIEELKELSDRHQETPIDFSGSNNNPFSSQKKTSITEENIKKYLETSTSFLMKVEEIIKREESTE